MDWDQAYSNVNHVANSADYPPKWQAASHEFRSRMITDGRLTCDITYGPHERNRFDLFLPEAPPLGLVVLVHGGYWLRFDRSLFSVFAMGALEHGFAVAVPSYVLCPEVRIDAITQQVGQAIDAASRMVEGPLHLVGHSAGGQLVARMVTSTSPLDPATIRRIRKVVPVSCVSDLRPLLRTVMNRELQLDLDQARAESPALLEPLEGIDVTAWVGAAELPEFVRQSALLANVWSGFPGRFDYVEEADRHHMNIVDGLMEAGHPLTKTLLGIG